MPNSSANASMNSSVLVSGSSYPRFAQEIAEKTGIPLLPTTISHFPDGETRVQLEQNVAGKHVFIIQSLGRKPNEFLIETLLIADALRRSAAASIVLVAPYLAYSRQSFQETAGSSLAARLFAHFMQEAGVTKLITMDLHAEHVPSFYDFPVEHLSACSVFVEEFRKRHLDASELVVVSPDLGAAKLASSFAKKLQSGLAIVQKQRLDADRVEILSLLGEVQGKNVLLADDVCSTAGTLASAAKVCRGKGAKKIFAMVTHGLFIKDALKAIEQSMIDQLFVTDTIAQDEILKQTDVTSKICVVPIASAFAASITRLRPV